MTDCNELKRLDEACPWDKIECFEYAAVGGKAYAIGSEKLDYLITTFDERFQKYIEPANPPAVIALIVENERLNSCLKWEQNRAERVGTHGPGCESWGPAHYECLLQKFGQICAKNDVLDIQVAILQSDENSWQSGYDKGRADGAKRSREEVSQLRAEVEALRKDAKRWRYARDLMHPDDIHDFQSARDSFGMKPTEEISSKCDAAIDDAMSQEGNSDE